jgi:hypothetical protein
MKKILVSLTLGLSLFSLSVKAGAYACYSAVENDRRVNKNDAIALCAGAEGLRVTDCLNIAFAERTLSNNQAKNLCQAAVSSAPISCYQNIREDRKLRLRVTSNEAQALCRGVVKAEGVVQCLHEAYETRGLSRPDAQLLCSGANDVTPVTCYVNAEDDRSLAKNQALQLCRVRDRFRQ